jgi:acid phosphatase (class A)
MKHLGALLLILFLFGQIFSQTTLPGHYAQLGKLNAARSSERKTLDAITFPWTEYSKSALSYTLFRTVYLLPADEAILPDLIRFPANSSAQTRAELNYLLSLQKSRTPEEIKRAEYIANIGAWPTILNPKDSGYVENRRQLFYMSQPVGQWLNPDEFPAITKLLMNCIQDIRATEFRLKKHFVRARPYHLEPDLQPLARINSPSFPSGHSLWAFSQAYLFSIVMPEKKDNFIDMAEEVRWSRELLGIHYPSDNEASKVISLSLLKYWHKNPQFVKDLQAAKKEWNAKKSLYEK